jgi:hypothetical protein
MDVIAGDAAADVVVVAVAEAGAAGVVTGEDTT